jgi:hypothetical protein
MVTTAKCLGRAPFGLLCINYSAKRLDLSPEWNSTNFCEGTYAVPVLPDSNAY